MRSRRPIVAGLVVGLAVAALQLYGTLEIFELAIYDRLFEMRGPRPPRAPIIIVAIDARTFADMPARWPYPRAYHAQVVSRLAEFKPLVIGVAIIFDQPSGRGPDDDAALGDAVRQAGNVVLAAAPKSEDTARRVEASGAHLPIPVIRQHAVAVAPANLFVDQDSNVRRAPLRVRLGGKPEISFDTAIYQIAAKSGLAVEPLPTTGDTALINFRGRRNTFKWVPYSQVYRGGDEIRPERFKNAIVLIGATTSVLRDVFPTPFARGGDMPGVEIHANAVETLVAGNRIREIPRAVAVVASLVCALLVGLLVGWWPGRAVLGTGALLLLVWGASYGAFVLLDIWFRVVGPSVAIVLALILAIVASDSRPTHEVAVE